VSHHFPRADDESPVDGEPFVIDCRVCVREGTTTCQDCVVTFICSREPDEAVIIDACEFRALRALEQGGLLPGLAHQPRAAHQA